MAPSLKSFPGKFNSISTIKEVEFSSLKARIQLMEEVEELFPSKQKDVKVANQLFDEMPKSFSMKTECLSSGRSLFDEMSYLSPVKQHDKIKGREEVVLQVINMSKFIFDPGGSTLHHMGCVAFESNTYSVFPIVCMTDYEDFVTELNSYVENGLRTNDSEIKLTIEGPHTQKIAIKCSFLIDENKRKMAGRRMETLLQITLSSCLKFMFDPGGQFEMRYPLTKTLEKIQRLKIRHRRFFLSTTNTTTDISTWHNQIVGDLEWIHCSKPVFGSGGGKNSSWHLVGVSQILVAASRKRKMDHSIRADLMLPIALLVKKWKGRTVATVASGYEPVVTLFDWGHKDNMLFPEFIKSFKAKLY